jgi:hypothetical protein
MVANKKVMVDSEVESEAKSTEGNEAKPQERYNNESKEVIDSKAQCVTDLKKKRTDSYSCCISSSTSYRETTIIKVGA